LSHNNFVAISAIGFKKKTAPTYTEPDIDLITTTGSDDICGGDIYQMTSVSSFSDAQQSIKKY